MTSILLNTSFFSAHSVMLIWIGGGLLFLLLCYGIFRQWRTGKRLRKELIEIEKVRQNNIEYDFVLKAMKIAVWRYDSSTKAFIYENDYRDGRDNYAPGVNESFVATLSAIAPADVERVSRAFEDLCEGRSDSYHQEPAQMSRMSGEPPVRPTRPLFLYRMSFIWSALRPALSIR